MSKFGKIAGNGCGFPHIPGVKQQFHFPTVQKPLSKIMASAEIKMNLPFQIKKCANRRPTHEKRKLRLLLNKLNRCEKSPTPTKWNLHFYQIQKRLNKNVSGLLPLTFLFFTESNSILPVAYLMPQSRDSLLQANHQSLPPRCRRFEA